MNSSSSSSGSSSVRSSVTSHLASSVSSAFSSSASHQSSSSSYETSSYVSSHLSSSAAYESSSSSFDLSSSSTGITILPDSLPPSLIGWAIACLIGTILLTSYCVKHYAQPRVPLPIKFIVWLCWLCCFSVVFLVPLDLSINLSTDPSLNPLSPVFATVYWISSISSWALLPFIQEYYDNGGFTIKQKTKIAIRNNVVITFIALTAFLGICLYLWLARHAGMDAIITTFKVLSNVVGFCLIIVLMGSGFVEFPRLLYHSSNRERCRDLLYYQLSQTHHEAGEVRDKVHLLIQLVDHVEEQVTQQGDLKLIKYMQTIKQSLTQPIAQTHQSLFVHLSIYDRLIGQSKFDVDDLIALNGSIKKNLDHLWLCDRLWSDTMKHVIRLEMECGDISINQTNKKSLFNRTYHQSIKPKLFLIGSIMFSLLSILILWCELSIPIKSFSNFEINPFTYLSDWLYRWPLLQQPLVVCLLAYCMLCALYPLFKLRLSSLYYLGRHHSSANSLIMISTLMLRASIALAYNFSLLLSIPSSGFGQLLSSITEVPFWGNSFNTIFPIFILVIALIVSLNALQRLLSCCGIDRFHFIRQSMEMERELSDSQQEAKLAVNEGKQLVTREKRKRDVAQKAGHKYHYHTDDIPWTQVNDDIEQSTSQSSNQPTNQSNNRSNNQSNSQSNGRYKRQRDPVQASLLGSSTSSYGTSDEVEGQSRSAYTNDSSTYESTKRQSAYASAYYGSADESESRHSNNQSAYGDSNGSNSNARVSAYGGSAYSGAYG